MSPLAAQPVRPDVPYFINQLPDDVRRAVLAQGRTCVYGPGETICTQGTPAHSLFFVVAGAGHRIESGVRMPIAVGDCFGETEVLRGAEYAATLVAASDVQVWVVGKGPLDALLARHAALALALARHLAQKLERENERRLLAPQPRASRTRCDIRAMPVVALLLTLLIGAGLSAGAVVFGLTTLNVGGLQMNAASTIPAKKQRPAPPTKVAQAVNLPAPTPTAKPEVATHTVSAGDTLGAIAIMHGTNLATVRTLNNVEGDVIRVGDPLTVPGGTVVIVPTRTSRPQPTPAPQSLRPLVALPSASSPTAAALDAMAGPPSPTPVALVWEMPAWTGVDAAAVAPGQKYYRLEKAIYFDEARAGGRVNIFVGLLDEDGKPLSDIPVKMEWGAGEYTTRRTEEKFDFFLQPYNLGVLAVHDMASGSSFSPDRGERGGYKISVEGVPSDVVSGLGLPLRRHVAFLLVFRRTTK